MPSAKAAPGFRVVAGYFQDRSAANGAVLLDERGRELFFWPIDRDAISDHVAGTDHPRHGFLHGFEVLRDGSVVVNFDSGAMLARLDPCGRVVWASSGSYHHAVNLYDDGSLWTVGGPETDSISRIDPETGRVQWTAAIEDFVKGAGKGVFAIRRDDREFDPGWLVDPFHINDVEILEDELADAFPLFTAGDVMVSLRSLNLVAVFDPLTLQLKWWQHGPWHRQHDPDFLPNGKISLFDNNMNGEASRIIEIEPQSREMAVVFKGSPETPFYTWIRGKHQHLDNGNMLITEPQSGRVFEVDRNGHFVWEYHNAYDEERNLLVSNAIWLPLDFFDAGIPECGNAVLAAGAR